MTLHLPAYRLTVYVANLDDAASTVLTPLAGSVHSNPFQVTTQAGVAGWQPYLHEVRGRQGGIDALEKSTSTGQMTVSLLDMRVGTNLERWVTAFMGDADGIEPLLKCKAYIEESLDAGSTWNPFFVGRVQEVKLAGALRVELVLRDFADDLGEDCYVGRPHASISYAVEPLLLPLGLSAAFGGQRAATAMTATIASTTFNGYRKIVLSGTDQSRVDNILTQALVFRTLGTLWRPDLTNQGSRLGFVRAQDGVRLRFSAASPSITQKEVRVVAVLPVSTSGTRWRVAEIAVAEVPAADPYYQAFDTGTISNGTALTAVTLRAVTQPREGVRRTVAPMRNTMLPSSTRSGAVRDPMGDPISGDAPLYLGGVNPAQHIQDLLAGKFGALATNGDVTRAHAVTASSFTALTSPGSNVNALPRLNFRIEQRATLRDAITAICQAHHLGWRLKPQHNSGNPISAVELVDMRLPLAASLSSIPTIAEADLDTATAVTWQHGAADARSAVLVRVYLEDAVTPAELETVIGVTPNIGTSLLKEYPIEIIPAEGIGRLELGTRFLEIDAHGVRQVLNNVTADNIDATPWLELQAAKIAELYRSLFGTGPLYLGWTARRTANTTGLWPGDWCVLDADVVIDPSTRVRGGARLVQITERSEDGPRIEFTAIDAGPYVSANVPTVGSAPATGTPNTNTATLSVTLNAASDPVVVEVNVTATSVGTQPAHNATGWVFVARLTASGTVTVPNLPSGMRVWFRARSEPSERRKTKALPSVWVVPGTTGYVDLTALGAPTGVSVSPPVPGTTDTVVASWTNAEAQLPIEAILTTGGTDTVIARLGVGTTSLTLNVYVTANTTYTFSVRYVDTLGGLGTKGTSASFTIPSGFIGPTLSAPTLTMVF